MQIRASSRTGHLDRLSSVKMGSSSLMSMYFTRIVLAGICVLFSGIFVSASGNAAELDITLQKIMEAPRIVDYEGILTTKKFTDEAEPVQNTHRIIHQKPDRNRIDRIDPTTMDKIVVIQVKQDVYRRETDGDST